MTLPRLALALIVLWPLAIGAMAQEPPSIVLWPNAPGSEGKTADELVGLNCDLSVIAP